MSATPESRVKKAVRKLLDTYGAYYFFPAANGFGRAGIPDIICCIRGRFLAIECKAGKNKTSGYQEMEIEAIRKHHGLAVVINENNLDELEDLLKHLANRERLD